jgi:hypothetical protein
MERQRRKTGNEEGQRVQRKAELVRGASRWRKKQKGK